MSDYHRTEVRKDPMLGLVPKRKMFHPKDMLPRMPGAFIRKNSRKWHTIDDSETNVDIRPETSRGIARTTIKSGTEPVQPHKLFHELTKEDFERLKKPTAFLSTEIYSEEESYDIDMYHSDELNEIDDIRNFDNDILDANEDIDDSMVLKYSGNFNFPSIQAKERVHGYLLHSKVVFEMKKYLDSWKEFFSSQEDVAPPSGNVLQDMYDAVRNHDKETAEFIEQVMQTSALFISTHERMKNAVNLNMVSVVSNWINTRHKETQGEMFYDEENRRILQRVFKHKELMKRKNAMLAQRRKNRHYDNKNRLKKENVITKNPFYKDLPDFTKRHSLEKSEESEMLFSDEDVEVVEPELSLDFLGDIDKMMVIGVEKGKISTTIDGEVEIVDDDYVDMEREAFENDNLFKQNSREWSIGRVGSALSSPISSPKSSVPSASVASSIVFGDKEAKLEDVNISEATQNKLHQLLGSHLTQLPKRKEVSVHDEKKKKSELALKNVDQMIADIKNQISNNSLDLSQYQGVGMGIDSSIFNEPVNESGGVQNKRIIDINTGDHFESFDVIDASGTAQFKIDRTNFLSGATAPTEIKEIFVDRLEDYFDRDHNFEDGFKNLMLDTAKNSEWKVLGPLLAGSLDDGILQGSLSMAMNILNEERFDAAKRIKTPRSKHSTRSQHYFDSMRAQSTNISSSMGSSEVRWKNILQRRKSLFDVPKSSFSSRRLSTGSNSSLDDTPPPKESIHRTRNSSIAMNSSLASVDFCFIPDSLHRDQLWVKEIGLHPLDLLYFYKSEIGLPMSRELLGAADGDLVSQLRNSVSCFSDSELSKTYFRNDFVSTIRAINETSTYVGITQPSFFCMRDPCVLGYFDDSIDFDDEILSDMELTGPQLALMSIGEKGESRVQSTVLLDDPASEMTTNDPSREHSMLNLMQINEEFVGKSMSGASSLESIISTAAVWKSGTSFSSSEFEIIPSHMNSFELNSAEFAEALPTEALIIDHSYMNILDVDTMVLSDSLLEDNRMVNHMSRLVRLSGQWFDRRLEHRKRLKMRTTDRKPSYVNMYHDVAVESSYVSDGSFDSSQEEEDVFKSIFQPIIYNASDGVFVFIPPTLTIQQNPNGSQDLSVDVSFDPMDIASGNSSDGTKEIQSPLRVTYNVERSDSQEALQRALDFTSGSFDSVDIQKEDITKPETFEPLEIIVSESSAPGSREKTPADSASEVSDLEGSYTHIVVGKGLGVEPVTPGPIVADVNLEFDVLSVDSSTNPPLKTPPSNIVSEKNLFDAINESDDERQDIDDAIANILSNQGVSSNQMDQVQRDLVKIMNTDKKDGLKKKPTIGFKSEELQREYLNSASLFGRRPVHVLGLNYEEKVERAQKARLNGKVKLAIIYTEQAIAEKPMDPKAYLERARLEFIAGLAKNAIVTAENCILFAQNQMLDLSSQLQDYEPPVGVDGDSIMLYSHSDFVEDLVLDEEEEDKLGAYIELKSLQKTCADAYWVLYKTELRFGKITRVDRIKLLTGALLVCPEHQACRFARALTAFNAGIYKISIEDLETLVNNEYITMEDDILECYCIMLLGESYLEMDRFLEANNMFKSALERLAHMMNADKNIFPNNILDSLMLDDHMDMGAFATDVDFTGKQMNQVDSDINSLEEFYDAITSLYPDFKHCSALNVKTTLSFRRNIARYVSFAGRILNGLGQLSVFQQSYSSAARYLELAVKYLSLFFFSSEDLSISSTVTIRDDKQRAILMTKRVLIELELVSHTEAKRMASSCHLYLAWVYQSMEKNTPFFMKEQTVLVQPSSKMFAPVQELKYLTHNSTGIEVSTVFDSKLFQTSVNDVLKEIDFSDTYGIVKSMVPFLHQYARPGPSGTSTKTKTMAEYRQAKKKYMRKYLPEECSKSITSSMCEKAELHLKKSDDLEKMSWRTSFTRGLLYLLQVEQLVQVMVDFRHYRLRILKYWKEIALHFVSLKEFFSSRSFNIDQMDNEAKGKFVIRIRQYDTVRQLFLILIRHLRLLTCGFMYCKAQQIYKIKDAYKILSKSLLIQETLPAYSALVLCFDGNVLSQHSHLLQGSVQKFIAEYHSILIDVLNPLKSFKSHFQDYVTPIRSIMQGLATESTITLSKNLRYLDKAMAHINVYMDRFVFTLEPFKEFLEELYPKQMLKAKYEYHKLFSLTDQMLMHRYSQAKKIKCWLMLRKAQLHMFLRDYHIGFNVALEAYRQHSTNIEVILFLNTIYLKYKNSAAAFSLMLKAYHLFPDEELIKYYFAQAGLQYFFALERTPHPSTITADKLVFKLGKLDFVNYLRLLSHSECSLVTINLEGVELPKNFVFVDEHIKHQILLGNIDSTRSILNSLKKSAIPAIQSSLFSIFTKYKRFFEQSVLMRDSNMNKLTMDYLQRFFFKDDRRLSMFSHVSEGSQHSSLSFSSNFTMSTQSTTSLKNSSTEELPSSIGNKIRRNSSIALCMDDLVVVNNAEYFHVHMFNDDSSVPFPLLFQTASQIVGPQDPHYVSLNLPIIIATYGIFRLGIHYAKMCLLTEDHQQLHKLANYILDIDKHIQERSDELEHRFVSNDLSDFVKQDVPMNDRIQKINAKKSVKFYFANVYRKFRESVSTTAQELLLSKGRSLVQQHKYGDAMDVFLQAHDRGLSLVSMIQYGRVLYVKEDYVVALQIFQTIVQKLEKVLSNMRKQLDMHDFVIYIQNNRLNIEAWGWSQFFVFLCNMRLKKLKKGNEKISKVIETLKYIGNPVFQPSNTKSKKKKSLLSLTNTNVLSDMISSMAPVSSVGGESVTSEKSQVENTSMYQSLMNPYFTLLSRLYLLRGLISLSSRMVENARLDFQQCLSFDENIVEARHLRIRLEMFFKNPFRITFDLTYLLRRFHHIKNFRYINSEMWLWRGYAFLTLFKRFSFIQKPVLTPLFELLLEESSLAINFKLTDMNVFHFNRVNLPVHCNEKNSLRVLKRAIKDLSIFLLLVTPHSTESNSELTDDQCKSLFGALFNRGLCYFRLKKYQYAYLDFKNSLTYAKEIVIQRRQEDFREHGGFAHLMRCVSLIEMDVPHEEVVTVLNNVPDSPCTGFHIFRAEILTKSHFKQAMYSDDSRYSGLQMKYALDEAKKMARIAPFSPYSFFNIGVIQFYMGDYDSAFKCFTTTISYILSKHDITSLGLPKRLAKSEKISDQQSELPAFDQSSRNPATPGRLRPKTTQNRRRSQKSNTPKSKQGRRKPERRAIHTSGGFRRRTKNPSPPRPPSPLIMRPKTVSALHPILEQIKTISAFDPLLRKLLHQALSMRHLCVGRLTSSYFSPDLKLLLTNRFFLDESVPTSFGASPLLLDIATRHDCSAFTDTRKMQTHIHQNSDIAMALQFYLFGLSGMANRMLQTCVSHYDEKGAVSETDSFLSFYLLIILNLQLNRPVTASKYVPALKQMYAKMQGSTGTILYVFLSLALSSIHIQRKQYSDSLFYLEFLVDNIEKYPRSVHGHIYHNITVAYYLMKDFERALHFCDMVISFQLFNSNDSTSFSLRAMIKTEMGCSKEEILNDLIVRDYIDDEQ
ncbi:hypothetical protein PCE1_002200 [Barthelona sp. PCE]